MNSKSVASFAVVLSLLALVLVWQIDSIREAALGAPSGASVPAGSGERDGDPSLSGDDFWDAYLIVDVQEDPGVTLRPGPLRVLPEQPPFELGSFAIGHVPIG